MAYRRLSAWPTAGEPSWVGRVRAAGRPAGAEGPGERRARNRGTAPLLGDAAGLLQHRGEQPVLGHRVDQPRHPAGQPGPPVDEGDRVVAARAQPALVVVREELGLVGRHVDVDRALVLAGLAGQAQLEGLGDVVVAPTAELVPAEHLEEHPGPSPGGVLLLPGRHVAGAHAAGVDVAALPDADAAGGGLAEVVVVVGEGEVGAHRRQPRVRATAQVVGGVVRVDHLARVHHAVGVPDRLELAERPDQLLAVHRGEQRAPGLPVAVLAGERAAVPGDEPGRAVEELAPLGHPVRGAEAEVDPAVDAALAEVTVERGLVVELLEQGAEVPQVVADLVRRHRGVLPAGVGRRASPGRGPWRPARTPAPARASAPPTRR